MVQTVHKINEDKLYLLHVIMWLGLCAKTQYCATQSLVNCLY